jgi:hypothetical protein
LYFLSHRREATVLLAHQLHRRSSRAPRPHCCKQPTLCCIAHSCWKISRGSAPRLARLPTVLRGQAADASASIAANLGCLCCKGRRPEMLPSAMGHVSFGGRNILRRILSTSHQRKLITPFS